MVIDSLVAPMTIGTFTVTALALFASVFYTIGYMERRRWKLIPFYIWGNIFADTAGLAVLTLMLVGLPGTVLIWVLAGIILAKMVVFITQMVNHHLKWWHNGITMSFYVVPAIFVWGIIGRYIISWF